MCSYFLLIAADATGGAAKEQTNCQKAYGSGSLPSSCPQLRILCVSFLYDTVIQCPTSFQIHKNGLDAYVAYLHRCRPASSSFSYMFLRFIKMLIWIFLVFTITTFAIIAPADVAGVKSTNEGLDRLSWTK